MRTNVLEPGVKVDLYGPTYNIDGIGFGLDFAIILDPAQAKTPEGKNSFYWGGAFGTWFWLDPTNDLLVDRHDAERQRQHADRRLAAGAPVVAQAGLRGSRGSEEVIVGHPFRGAYFAIRPAVMPLASEYDAPTAPTMQVSRVRPTRSRMR